MKSVYLDNSATSFPKPESVVRAVVEYMTEIGANVNRSTHANAKSASMRVYETRELAKRLFHFKGDESHVIFTPGATFSLNQAIKGYLQGNEHVLVSSLEHNAVMRPLRELEKQGLRISLIPADKDGLSDLAKAKELLDSGVDMLILSHASNVCGAILPLEELCAIAYERRIPVVLDASQSAGHIEVDFDALHLSALCTPAHKGLLAPQGLGLLILEEVFAKQLRPLVSGGTGSLSNSDVQPEFLPDKLESGTPNIPAIFGLHASLEYLLERGIGAIREREIELTDFFLSGLQKILQDCPGTFRIVGPADASTRLGVISLDFRDFDNAEVSEILESEHGIKTRCGLHCAPIAHKTLGSYPQGTVRFSLSHFSSKEELAYTLDAIKELNHG